MILWILGWSARDVVDGTTSHVSPTSTTHACCAQHRLVVMLGTVRYRDVIALIVAFASRYKLPSVSRMHLPLNIIFRMLISFRDFKSIKYTQY